MSLSTNPTQSVSCLVISRTPALLNRLLASLVEARKFWQPGDEVLCSWNGSSTEEAEINPKLGPRNGKEPLFRIAQHCAYHFSGNMNALADLARGEILVLLNDDLILDPGSLDRAIQVLRAQPRAGLIGGRLRSSNGHLTHAGLLFSNDHVPYNRFRPDDLGPLIDASANAVQESGPMPAVTGALMVLYRHDFQAVRFHTEYRVCGEDIALCLDIWNQLNKQAYYASDVTAIHDEKTTRGKSFEEDDIRRLSTYAANILPEHHELQALGRYWSSLESMAMWHLLQGQRHELEQAKARLHEQEISQKMEQERYRQRIDELNERSNELEQQSLRAEATIQAMEGSSSWQLTAPLRVIGDKLKPAQQAPAAEPVNSLTHLSLPTIQELKTQSALEDSGEINLIFDALILGQANRANVSRGGIYRYASELIVALQRSKELQRILPYCPDPLLAGSVQQELEHLEQRFNVSLKRDNQIVPSRAFPGRSNTLAPSPALKRLLKPAYNRWIKSSFVRNQAKEKLEQALQDCAPSNTIFHTPFQSVPQEVRESSLRAVAVTVHDMLPRIHPEFFTAETIRQFDALLEQLKPSDHVICVSQSTRRDFLRFHPSIPESYVHVTHLAASPELQPVTDPAALQNLREQLSLRETDLVILSLCTLEPRKNLTTLIDAFEKLLTSSDGSSIKLVLAGSLGWKTNALTERLRSSSAADCIVISGHIPDHQLASLYSLADIFVYPSVYEGFGLPPLEAMQCGTPVLVGNTSSLPEVVGDAAILIDPRSSMELQEGLSLLLGSEQRLQALRDAGLQRAAQFSWQKTAELTHNIYNLMIESER